MEWLLKLADELIPDWMVGIVRGGGPGKINTTIDGEVSLDPSLVAPNPELKIPELTINTKDSLSKLIKVCHTELTKETAGRLNGRFKSVINKLTNPNILSRLPANAQDLY